jgi:hypothetical protein
MSPDRLDAMGPDGFFAQRMTFYAAIYPRLREVAREHGYALALHGSLTKDLDLLAVPWVVDADDEATLVRAIVERVDAADSAAPRSAVVDDLPRRRGRVHRPLGDAPRRRARGPRCAEHVRVRGTAMHRSTDGMRTA